MSASASALAPSPKFAAPFRSAAPSESLAATELRRAMESYKRRSGRQFPTWSEVLEVIRELGYAKRASAQEAPVQARVRLGPGGARGDEIGAVLRARGGVRSASEPGPTYDFATEAARDDALAAARSGFGWTCVEPA
jgi:hypothetical protein